MMAIRTHRTLRTIFCLAGLFLFNPSVLAKITDVRTMQNFDSDWKFHLGDLKDAQQSTFNDRAWKSVTLPHDWSIAGPFHKENAGGKSGGYVTLGIGWYRKSFVLPPEMQTKTNHPDTGSHGHQSQPA
jgi:beta-galactosidase